MEATRLWYAVQEYSGDGWGYGSYDYDEACEMLEYQGCGLIAVIDPDTSCCLLEIPYEEL